MDRTDLFRLSMVETELSVYIKRFTQTFLRRPHLAQRGVAAPDQVSGLDRPGLRATQIISELVSVNSFLRKSP